MESNSLSPVFKVVEIFDSIEGEGKRSGMPASFIRLAGCNLRCTYCDTAYALWGEKEPCVFSEMSLEQIIAKTNAAFKRVTLTGGEPLLHPYCVLLINRMTELGFEVNIETNGAVDMVDILNSLENKDSVFFTIDYKLPSSGMESKMLWHNFESLRSEDVIKFVVGSNEDAQKMLVVLEKLRSYYATLPHIFTGIVYGAYDPKSLVSILLNNEVLKDAHYQIQLHKTIWSPDERGV